MTKIKKVHCLFEQSGAFKRAFIKRGITAYDYDIDNKFGETDFIIDIFAEIDKEINGDQSIFSKISEDDLIMAFFPCTYFSQSSFINHKLYSNNMNRLNTEDKIHKIIDRIDKRSYFLKKLTQLYLIVIKRNLKMIIENPASGENYLFKNFLVDYTMIDYDRTLRGDQFRKPTAYWFINIDRTYGITKKIPSRIYKVNNKNGIHKSTMTIEYAENFIKDFIFGRKYEKDSEYELF